MLGPNWEEGCKCCSFLADHFDATRVHLAHRDVAFVAISRAPMPPIQAFQNRMGWRFPWVSAFGNSFNRDYGVHFTKEELAGEVNYNYGKIRFGSEEAPGLSVFYKDEAGEVFHTYSAYGRGLDAMIGTYHFLDLVPKGRDEEGLAFSMWWVRHHDKYGDDYGLVPVALKAESEWRRFQPANPSEARTLFSIRGAAFQAAMTPSSGAFFQVSQPISPRHRRGMSSAIFSLRSWRLCEKRASYRAAGSGWKIAKVLPSES